MGKILLDGNWRKKEKGITLIEILVSLSIIILVSVAAVSIATYSATMFNTINVKRFFQREIDNIAELYLSYEGVDFSTAFKELTGKTITVRTDDGGFADSTYYINSSFQYVESVDEYAYKINLTFSGATLDIASTKSDNSPIRSRSVKR